MNESKNYQPELFDEFSKNQKKGRMFFKKLPRAQKINIIVSQEKLIFFAIAIVILFIIIFSLGVERGKKIEATRYFKKAKYTQQTAEHEVKSENEKELKKIVTAIPVEQKIFTVQVAAFKKLPQANEEVKKLKEKNDNVFIEKRGDYNIVYVGKFKNKQEALNKQNKLKIKYKDCFIRKINKDTIYGTE